MNEPLLELYGISKRFVGVCALDNVSFNIGRGEVHIVIGENGAGKSTLCKIIMGIYSRTSGTMKFEGREYDPHSVNDAQNMGINMIHQELNLLQNRTVAQNIYIGREPLTKAKFIDEKRMNKECGELLKRLELDSMKPETPVSSLSIAQQQMVEVAKALSRNSKLLIMDEPTSSLTEKEIQILFKLTRKLVSEGVSVVYISHRMPELKEIGDVVTVMRDGGYIGTYDLRQMELDELIHLMVGRKITDLYHRNFNQPGEVLLETNKLSGLRFRNIDIAARRGEIVGIAGLVGAGRTELVLSLFGYDPIETGALRIHGKIVKFKGWNPRKAIAGSAALLPEDRKELGLILQMPISANIIQSSFKKHFKHGIIRRKVEYKQAELYVKKLRIATPSVHQLAGNLSGGNQQKVVLGKWLCTDSDIIIFDEPTRGIDVGAKAEIYALMDELAAAGKSIIMISSEMAEIVNLSDRIYVMKDGEITGELVRGKDQISQEIVMDLAIKG
jgi:ABC-type sugar transport system ATPase subunit